MNISEQRSKRCCLRATFKRPEESSLDASELTEHWIRVVLPREDSNDANEHQFTIACQIADRRVVAAVQNSMRVAAFATNRRKNGLSRSMRSRRMREDLLESAA